jgi:hypothetical protein
MRHEHEKLWPVTTILYDSVSARDSKIDVLYRLRKAYIEAQLLSTQTPLIQTLQEAIRHPEPRFSINLQTKYGRLNFHKYPSCALP